MNACKVVFFLGIGALGSMASASDVVEVQAITDKIVLVHFKDGYVVHSKLGQARSDEKVITDPLNITEASKTAAYSITSTDDANFKTAVAPTSIGRKSKGTDFAWYIDTWVNGYAVNNRPDHTKEHWLYLYLPTALTPGRTYAIRVNKLAKNGTSWNLKFDPTANRSDLVHVNTIGYVPNAPQKFGYVYGWLGDRGQVSLNTYAGKAFRLIDVATKKTEFTGKLVFRKGASNPETGQGNDTPNANFLGADVYECDFSAFNKAGQYVLSVDGIGASYPFVLNADAYRICFQTTARGLFHNRSGIALTKPYTSFERPAPHNPKLTPSFAGKLKYTTSRVIDWNNSDNDASDKPAIEKGIKGTLDSAGWYQDAGDWDSYPTHLKVAEDLLFAFEMAPKNFVDKELNIPESGNNVPDILDEAAWLPRFCRRLRMELIAKKWGTGGIGLRICGDHFGGDGEGVPSYKDTNRTWIVSGEDPMSTYRYAGVAAHLAYALKLAGVKDPEGVSWETEAKECYAWAAKNTRSGDDDKVRNYRRYAAAGLFRITGNVTYLNQYVADAKNVTNSTNFDEDDRLGPYVIALGGGPVAATSAVVKTAREAILSYANFQLDTAKRRALRWAGNYYFPMLVGQQTTPIAMPVAVAYTLSKTSNPTLAATYLGALYTTADYFLGTNALNMTWCTGLGPKKPLQVFHIDAWYNGKSTPHPGVVPYGPWRKDKDRGNGPWDHDWVNQTVYPKIDLWPGGERWFDTRWSPQLGEFTIHQTTAPSAAFFGFLCGQKVK